MTKAFPNAPPLLGMDTNSSGRRAVSLFRIEGYLACVAGLHGKWVPAEAF